MLFSMESVSMGGEASLDSASRIHIALRGDGVPLAGFSSIHPPDLLGRFASQIGVRENRVRILAGEPVSIVSGAPSRTGFSR